MLRSINYGKETNLPLQHYDNYLNNVVRVRKKRTEAESFVTSLDFDALRLICLRLDLKQCISANVSSASTKIPDYTILPFPASYQSRKQVIVANQFIIQHDNQMASLQKMYYIRFDFVTSNISEELLFE
jgi:hypothetical protein